MQNCQASESNEPTDLTPLGRGQAQPIQGECERD